MKCVKYSLLANRSCCQVTHIDNGMFIKQLRQRRFFSCNTFVSCLLRINLPPRRSYNQHSIATVHQMCIATNTLYTTAAMKRVTFDVSFRIFILGTFYVGHKNLFSFRIRTEPHRKPRGKHATMMEPSTHLYNQYTFILEV